MKHDRPFPDWVVTLTQLVTYLIFSLPLRLLFCPRRMLPDNLQTLKKGSLIISNHQSRVDPFLAVYSLPLHIYWKILPIRFPTTEHYYKSWLNPRYFPAMKMLGCFNVGMTSAERMKVIFEIRKYLRDGSTIFLFPEGAIIEESNVKQFKQGVDFFMHDAPCVMFMRLHGLNKAYEKKDGPRKIVFGEVFCPPPDMTLEEMRMYLQSL